MARKHALKVQQKDWTLKTSTEKLTLTCVNMHTPFSKVVSLKYNHEILAGARLSESFRARKFALGSAERRMLSLLTNQATLDSQLGHVAASRVHA